MDSLVCSFCGSIVRPSKKFCSAVCVSKHWHKQSMDTLIRTGSASTDKGYFLSKATKPFLLARDGNLCQLCKLESWQEKPIPLVIDHIDGDSMNNLLTNLRLICCNCDALLPTYKGRNKGKGMGRAYRRQRYAEGKSW